MATKKVSSQEGHAAGRDVLAGPVNNVHAIHGGMNVIGNQGHITIHTAPPARRGRGALQQHDPAIHISQEQQVALQRLRDEWVALHNRLKARSLDYGAALRRINTAADATACALIRQDRYDIAVAYVRQQMAMLAAMKSAPRKDPSWRNKRYGSIKARCKNQLGNEFAYVPYISKHFNAESLTELDDEQLEAAYRHTLRLKPKRAI